MVISIFYTKIGKSRHYREEHEKKVPWSKVIELIFTIKNKRRKGNRIEIENDKFYLLCKIEDKTLYVINAKRK